MENHKSYEQGIDECVELLEALKQYKEDDFHARLFIIKQIQDKEKLFDKNHKLIQEWDVMSINPDDDSWLDLVIRYTGKLIYATELIGNEPIRLRDCLYGSDNPSVVVGNLRNNRVEFHEW